MDNFGEQLKKLRKDKGLTQEKLADLLFINRSTLAGYEIGKREPSLRMACNIADFFNVSVDFLLGRKGYV